MSGINQRNATRNQSTADFIRCEHIFLFDNHFQEAVFKNTTGSDYTLKPGSLVLRDTTASKQVKPAVDDDTIDNVIGIVFIEEEVTLAANETLDINYAIDGGIDETKLALPGTVTLDTVATGKAKTLRDNLNGQGFQLEASVQNTKYDN